jgi:hypothetical protein
MAWYSDEALEAFAIVVWSLALVLFLVSLALPCHLCRRCNKCVTSLLRLIFVSHLVTSDEGTLQTRYSFSALIIINRLKAHMYDLYHVKCNTCSYIGNLIRRFSDRFAACRSSSVDGRTWRELVFLFSSFVLLLFYFSCFFFISCFLFLYFFSCFFFISCFFSISYFLILYLFLFLFFSFFCFLFFISLFSLFHFFFLSSFFLFYLLYLSYFTFVLYFLFTFLLSTLYFCFYFHFYILSFLIFVPPLIFLCILG